jgi:diacylglycerol kinase family enzyme
MIDVGTVNGKVFTTVAGAGFDAEVVSRMVRRRRGHITHLDYFSPLWRTFWEHRFPVIRVFVDGRQVFDRRGLVMVGNIARYGAGLPILRDARDDDGLLDVCAYACSWQAPLLMHAAYTFAGRHRGRSSVTYAQGVRIRMESTSAVPLQTDGDAAGWLPADFTVIRGGAILCLPA